MDNDRIEMSPEAIQGDAAKDSRWVDERLEHDKQRRRHKACIFYISLVMCILLFGVFVFWLAGLTEFFV